MIRKVFVAKSQFDDGERAVISYINTATVDRDREVVTPGGARLNNYKKNPVVLWMHDHALPIARNDWIKRDDRGLLAKTIFANTELGQEVYQLYRDGVLRAFSVSFSPIASHCPTPAEIKKDPDLSECRCIYDKWELHEYSCVSVPSNPEALAVAVSKGLTLKSDVFGELRKQIDELKAAQPSEPEPTPEPPPAKPTVVVLASQKAEPFRPDPVAVSRQLADATSALWANAERAIAEWLKKEQRRIDRLCGRM